MKLTIDKKVSFIIIVLIFLFGSLLGVYFVETQSALLREEAEEWATGSVHNLAANLEYPVLIRDQEAISRIVKAALAQKDVVFCRVEGSGGTRLHEEGGGETGSVKVLTAPIIARTAAGEEALIFSSPQEKTEEIGKVFLTISFLWLDRKIAEIRRTITTFVVIAGVIASLGTYLLLKRLIGRPVERLVAATERIAAGDLAYRIPHITKDEFEKLAVSFNQMAGSLLEAQEELVREEKLAVLGQLAANVGNELRNPLGVMNNAVFFLKNALAGADATVEEYLDIIKNEIANAHRVISDFVDFFRTKTPKLKVAALRDIIDESLRQSDVPAEVSVHVELPATLPLVKVDTIQMRQVLQNLVTNAVQAMPGGGALRIAARETKDEGRGTREGKASIVQASGRPSSVEISVSDTGEGIAPENREKIFQPLFSTKSRGIGLGLAICKSFVEVNGGDISVESEPGKGTTFTVTLPAEMMLTHA